MPVEWGANSNYGKEMRRWEATHTQFGAPGRPYVFREFPKRLYRAERVEGQVKIVESIEVPDAEAEAKEGGKGFRFRQEDALALIRKDQLIHGTLAAEREWEIQHNRISERATAEVRVVEAEAGAVHVPVIPETPIPAHRKRGRKPRAETPAPEPAPEPEPEPTAA